MQPGNVSAGRWIQCSGPGSVGLRHLEAFGFSQNRGMPPCLSKSSSKYWVTPWSCCLSQINRDEGVGAPETRLGVHVRNAGLSSWVCGHLSVQFVSQDCGARRAWGRLTPEAGALPAPLLRAARLRSALPDSGLFQSSSAVSMSHPLLPRKLSFIRDCNGELLGAMQTLEKHRPMESQRSSYAIYGKQQLSGCQAISVEGQGECERAREGERLPRVCTRRG